MNLVKHENLNLHEQYNVMKFCVFLLLTKLTVFFVFQLKIRQVINFLNSNTANFMNQIEKNSDLNKGNNSIGICLSGGAALGFGHIGALQALEDNGIIPEYVSGSSMGAIIGAFYCAGFSPEELLQLIKTDKLYKITKLMTFQPTFLNSGLTNHSILRSLVKELIPNNSFEQLQKRLYICVVNLNRADWEIVDSGNKLDTWLAASAAIPGLFNTIKQNGVFYTDGGLLNNLPAQPLTERCDTIIGINVIPHRIPEKLKKPVDTLAYAIRAVQFQNSASGRALCNFLIEPDAFDKYHEFSFDAYQDIYNIGYTTTSKYITEHPKMLELRKL